MKNKRFILAKLPQKQQEPHQKSNLIEQIEKQDLQILYQAQILEKQTKQLNEELNNKNQINKKCQNQEIIINDLHIQIYEEKLKQDQQIANFCYEKVKLTQENNALKEELDSVNKNSTKEINLLESFVKSLLEQQKEHQSQLRDLNSFITSQNQDLYMVINNNFEKLITSHQISQQQNFKEEFKKFSDSNKQIESLLKTLQENLQQNQPDDELEIQIENLLNQAQIASGKMIDRIRDYQNVKGTDSQIDKLIQYCLMFSTMFEKLKNTLISLIKKFNKQQQQIQLQNQQNQQLINNIQEIIQENSRQITKIQNQLNQKQDIQQLPEEIIDTYKQYTNDNTQFLNELRQENSKFLEKINNEIIQLFQTVFHQGEQLIPQKDEDLLKDDKDPDINQFDESAQSHTIQQQNSQEPSLLGFNYTFYNTTNLYSIIQQNRNILISKYGQNKNICMIKFLQYLDNMENLINNVKLTTQNCYYKNQQILNQINQYQKEKDPQIQKQQNEQESDQDQDQDQIRRPLPKPPKPPKPLIQKFSNKYLKYSSQ